VVQVLNLVASMRGTCASYFKVEGKVQDWCFSVIIQKTTAWTVMVITLYAI